MRASNSVKLMSLVFLGVFSWVVTSSFFGAARRSHASDPPRVVRGKSATSTNTVAHSVEAQDGQTPALRDMHGRNLGSAVARFELQQMNVDVSGRNVAVSAKVGMLDLRDGMSYVWAVVVRDRATNRAVRNHVYDDQVFSLGLERAGAPTFLDVFHLPPGSYNVEIRLCHVRNEAELAKLKHTANAGPLAVVSDVRAVEIR